MYNPYISKKFIVNCISKEERLKLKKSLLGQTIRIIIDPQYGLLTEHGFPVAVATYGKFDVNKLKQDFFAKIISIEPMVTIYEIQ